MVHAVELGQAAEIVIGGMLVSDHPRTAFDMVPHGDPGRLGILVEHDTGECGSGRADCSLEGP